MAVTNPWTQQPKRRQAAGVTTLRSVPPPTSATPPVPRPTGWGLRLWRPVGTVADLFWVGAHGGAGESTLAAALPRAAATDHRWPDLPGRPAVAVLVGRTSATGLAAVQAALAQHARGEAGTCRLLGLVLSADAPGRRRPRELDALIRRISGGAPPHPATGKPAVWTLPWVEEWRLHPAGRPPPLPDPVAAVLDTIAAAMSEQLRTRHP